MHEFPQFMMSSTMNRSLKGGAASPPPNYPGIRWRDVTATASEALDRLFLRAGVIQN